IIFDAGSKKWTVNTAYQENGNGKGNGKGNGSGETSVKKTQIPVGVLWFEGAVDINLVGGTYDLVNTIIATGEIKIDTKDGGPSNKVYAPYDYYLENGNASSVIARICGSSSTGIPTQYCDTSGALKT